MPWLDMRTQMMKSPQAPGRPSALSLAVAALALLLSGCAVGPDYHPSAAPEVKAFTRGGASEPANPSAVRKLDAQWWKAYGSDRVNALVDRALAHNPGLEAGSANLRQAQELVTAQRGLFFPQLGLGYNASRQNSGQVLSSPLNSGQSLFTLHTAQLSVGYVPDVFGANQRQVESLQAGADNQRLQNEALKVTLASNVTSAVIQEQLLLEQIAVLQEALAVGREQLRQTGLQKAAGYSSAMDLAQQEAAYAQTAALLPPLNKQLELTRDLLAVLCGEFPAADLGADQGPKLHPPAALPEALPSQLVSQRPDVQAAEALVHAANAEVGVAVANTLPQFSLTASLGYSGNALGGLLSSANKAWSLLGGVSQPLFAGGSLSARQRAAEAAAEAARAQYKSVLLTAFQNVADALYSLQADGHALDTARDAEAANLKLLQMTEQQFKQGYTAQPTLLSVRQTYLQAKLARVAAESTYLGDTVSLYQALGGGWHEEPEQAARQP